MKDNLKVREVVKDNRMKDNSKSTREAEVTIE